MGTLQDANTAAVLSAGQSPAWALQSSSGYPSASTDGVNVSGSLRSLIEVHTSLSVGKRSALLIPVFDATTTYSVTINGTTVGASGVDVDAAMVALEAAINANATINTIVVATAVTAGLTAVAGSNTRLLVEGLSDVPYSFDVSVAGGGGTVSGKADPITTDVYLYELAGGSNPSGQWVGINSFSPVQVGPDGFAERIDTAGLARVAARMVYTGLFGDGAAISYAAMAYIGPTL